MRPKTGQDTEGDLATLLPVVSEGVAVVDTALLLTLYFRDGHTQSARESIISCIELFFEINQEKLTFQKHPKTFAWHPIPSPKVPTPRAWIKTLDEDDSWEFEFKGGETPDSADAVDIQGLTLGEWEDSLSYLRISLPARWWADHSFIKLALQLAEKLTPLSGYGGLGIIESPNSIIADEFEPVVFSIAQRFPGLEIDYPVSHSIYLEDGIKGVNWLTLLDDQFVERMGGVPALRDALDKSFILHEYPGGIIIQAGDRPEIGDRERHLEPMLYRRLAQALKPIRIVKHQGFQHDGSGRFDTKSSEEWLARFDEMP